MTSYRRAPFWLVIVIAGCALGLFAGRGLCADRGLSAGRELTTDDGKAAGPEIAPAPAWATANPQVPEGRIFILMVWDGLRPDLVNPRDTPNLFALGREGVRFARHHSVFPTVTMVNAASIASGGRPVKPESWVT